MMERTRLLWFSVVLALFAFHDVMGFLYSYTSHRQSSSAPVQQSIRQVQFRQGQSIHWKLAHKSSLQVNSSDDDPMLAGGVAKAGFLAQPVVCISLYKVATTASGLPAGPFGLVGALEGVSYLIVLGFCITLLYRKVSTGQWQPMTAVERLSSATLVAGLTVLLNLVIDQGCVPNAKPILDYSNYLPVCDATPGLFGE